MSPDLSIRGHKICITYSILFAQWYTKSLSPLSPATWHSTNTHLFILGILTTEVDYFPKRQPLLWNSNFTISQTTNLDSSKLKEFADDNFKFDEHERKFFRQLENTVGKGEIARYFTTEPWVRYFMTEPCRTALQLNVLNSFPNDKFQSETLPNSKSLKTTTSNWMKMAESSPNR